MTTDALTGTDVLAFDWHAVGSNGRVVVTMKLGGSVLTVEKLDVLNVEARAKCAERLCDKHAGIDRSTVDAQLLGIAAEIVEPNKAQKPDTSLELDVGAIVRPERFILPDVSGLTVAVPMLINGVPGGKWALHLRWANGKREVIDLPRSLLLGDQRLLWFYPTPGTPTISTEPAWTQNARHDWLAGNELIEPAEVFQRLCQCIAHYVFFPQEWAAGATAMLALWVMLTYSYVAWSAVPYLYLGGQLESGKSRTFEVLSRLVFRPLLSSNMTAPALFRTLHERGGTLLFDEAERLKDTTPDVGELRSMLLAGYKRGSTATRLE